VRMFGQSVGEQLKEFKKEIPVRKTKLMLFWRMTFLNLKRKYTNTLMYLSDKMIYGNVKSMEHYRELMGNLEALNHVDQELKNLLEKQEQRNE
jgi:hypothetical protein